ncbi:MAG TPA: alkaline phosphatase [Gemmatimonadales bacterium]|jgi:alkaline phosphatase
MKRAVRVLLILTALRAWAVPAFAQNAATVPRIILFIGDGVGTGQWTAAAFAADRLAVHQFPVVGLVDVRPTDQKITDSAASATAYATGVRTYNGAIGVAPDSTPVPTILELATERGLATGLVATSRITHATPASFAAHVPDRGMEMEIARQMIQDHEITVIMGGGRAWFDGRRRPDARDLLAEVRARYTVITTPEALEAVDATGMDRLFALVSEDHMPAAVQAIRNHGRRPEADTGAGDEGGETWLPLRIPTLGKMTSVSLDVLDRDPDGFFLMVEAAQPDWRSHGNEPLGAVVGEMLDFDGAIAAALEYQRRRPETLILVTGDHETGGLAIQYGRGGSLVAAYTTGDHTAQLIPLFAKGPGAERFAGVHHYDEVGRRLLQYLQDR